MTIVEILESVIDHKQNKQKKKRKMATKRSVGTPTTEKILGSAALQLEAATKSMKDAYVQTEKIAEVLQQQTLRIAENENRISELTTEYTQKKAEQDFNLQLSHKQDKAKFAEEYLAENRMRAVPVEDYAKTTNALNTLRSDFDKRVTEKEQEINARLAADYSNKAALNKAEFDVKEAENKAKIGQLEAQLASANATAEMWKEQLSSERQAGIERAKAGAIGSINLPSSGK